jgi:hypothetical protein
VNYDDEILMAFVDGELDAKLQAEIAAAIEKDPALARRVEQQRALNTKVAGVFAKVLNQPVPERLTRAARGAAASESAASRGNVLQFPARAARAPAAPWHAREWGAMAASLMIGALISWRVLAPGEGAPVVAGKGALVANGELARALETQLASGQRGEEPVLIGLTFKARDGNYCRSFVLRSTKTAGLACRVGSDWQVPVTDSADIPSGELQQANSAVAPAILRAIEARGVGVALDAEAEKSAQQSGWKPANPREN